MVAMICMVVFVGNMNYNPSRGPSGCDGYIGLVTLADHDCDCLYLLLLVL